MNINARARLASLTLVCLLANSLVYAANGTTGVAADSSDIESRVTGNTQPSSLQEASERTGSTTIISTIDNPLTTNIVAWQETADAYHKNALEFSALKDSLTPTDRDQLQEETLYSKVLIQNSQ